MRITKLLSASLLLWLLGSCSTPKDIVYFQNQQYDYTSTVPRTEELKVKPGDKLSIVVNSRDPLLADLFNLPVISHRVGYSQASSLNTSQQILCYNVNKDGMIDFPVLGKIPVVGKDREEIAAYIKENLIQNNLVQDPIVTVEYANLYVTVIGEVNKPGRYYIDQDKLTVLDAIGLAEDLTIFGKRNSVIVMREVDGQEKAYKLDLTSTDKLFSSPAYHLQQRDVVYVEPNETKARQSTVNGNNVRSTSFWISLASLLTSVAVLIFK